MGLQKNFVYSSILTVSNYVFPLIIFPYIFRVLGVANVGICSFIDNIINYFVIFSMLGVSAIGIRETAASRTNKEQLNKVFSSLITLNGLFTVALLCILILCTQFIDKLNEYQHLLYIGAFKLFFNFLLIEWFYTGLEDFKYITERSLLVKLFYVIAVFVFVRKEKDYDIYFVLTVLMVVVNAIINIVRSRRIVNYSIRDVNLKKYFKAYVVLGVYMILATMYTSFNIIFLGFTSTNEEVGYFSTIYKLIIIFLAIYTAWTNVVMPRMSSLFSGGEYDEFKQLIKKSISVLLSFSVPIIIIGMLFSSDIILLISGKGYEKAAILLQILMPLIFIIGYSQILVMQILIPYKADKLLVFVSGSSAFLGILLNALLVPLLHSIGSSVSWLSSELCVLVLAQFFTYKKIGIKFPIKIFFRNIIAYLPAVLFCILIYFYVTNIFFIRLIIASVFMLIYFVTVQYFYLKNDFFLSKFNKILKVVF